MADKKEFIMKDSNKQDIKHLNAVFFDDVAIELDLLEKQLRLEKHFKKRRERDQAFIELAFKALYYCVEQCKDELKTKYPSYKALQIYLAHKGD